MTLNIDPQAMIQSQNTPCSKNTSYAVDDNSREFALEHNFCAPLP